jgi:hypothetical protein
VVCPAGKGIKSMKGDGMGIVEAYPNSGPHTSLFRAAWLIGRRQNGKILHIIERILLCVEIVDKLSRMI